jgi:NADPH:quinone reductase-like Zn-dependent oxidoreductase
LKGITAEFLLHDVYAVKPGDIILVHVAASGVGQLLSRWAKALWATVIGSTSPDAKAEQAQRAGCDYVIISATDDLSDAVTRLTEVQGARVVYDAIGKDTFEASIRTLAPHGHRVLWFKNQTLSR